MLVAHYCAPQNSWRRNEGKKKQSGVEGAHYCAPQNGWRRNEGRGGVRISNGAGMTLGAINTRVRENWGAALAARRNESVAAGLGEALPPAPTLFKRG